MSFVIVELLEILSERKCVTIKLDKNQAGIKTLSVFLEQTAKLKLHPLHKDYTTVKRFRK